MKALIIAIVAASFLLSGCTGGLPGQGQTNPTPEEEGCSFSGTWDTTWGEMNLAQTGSDVSGTYEYREGRLNGTAEGNTMRGQWGENATLGAYQPPYNAGDVVFVLTEDCGTILGAWGFGPDANISGCWIGTRKK